MNTQFKHLAYGEVFDPVTKALLENELNRKSDESMKKERRHIWEVHDYLRCPIIGTCLAPAEQKQILKKGGGAPSSASEYEIHSLLVNIAGKENKVSVMIETTLNRKYQSRLDTYARLTGDELLSAWEENFKTGAYDALFWFVCSMTDVSDRLLSRVFGDLHMQMHAVSKQCGHDRQAVVRMERETERLTQHLQELKGAYRQECKARQALEKDCAALRNKCAALEKERQDLIEKPRLPAAAQDELNAAKHENTALLEEIAGLTESLRFMQQAYNALEAENHALRKKPAFPQNSEVPGPSAPPADECPGKARCAACNLCRRRVLIVGGMTKMECFYRKAVETCGGAFEYHDGYMQNGGISALENKVRRADLVLCPVNCNSHGACLTAKRLCRKYGKMVRMLSGGSLSSIAQSLWQYEKDALASPVLQQ